MICFGVFIELCRHSQITFDKALPASGVPSDKQTNTYLSSWAAATATPQTESSDWAVFPLFLMRFCWRWPTSAWQQLVWESEVHCKSGWEARGEEIYEVRGCSTLVSAWYLFIRWFSAYYTFEFKKIQATFNLHSITGCVEYGHVGRFLDNLLNFCQNYL